MNKKRIQFILKGCLLLLCMFFLKPGNAQINPFEIALEPMTIEGVGGLQSFAWGQHEGKWLIIGGRLDGLHQRQPFAAFDLDGHNNHIFVIDPVGLKTWSAPLTSLPVNLQEQLRATNMEFFQDGESLYLVGGYGYSQISANHITFPFLTAVKVPEVIDAIIQGNSLDANFRQIQDTMFAVTGGYLNKIYDTYYLTGGQNFIGRYNPMGPDFGPGFYQQYTNESRRFRMVDNGKIISISHLPAFHDEANLHRRDFNVVPQIMPSGEQGLTAFSGVFQVDVDLPFLNCVNIDSTDYALNDTFVQKFNHYHCAHIPIYNSAAQEMHTIFFGGIARYLEVDGQLTRDDDVPFVKTIARVTRTVDGTMTEYKLPIEMPALLGAGSEFIPVEGLPTFDNGVLKLDDLATDTTLVGYIYGGIQSTAPNIFFINDGNQSNANHQIFKVFVIKNETVGTKGAISQVENSLNLKVYSNPNDGNFVLKFQLRNLSDVTLTIRDVNGKLIEHRQLENLVVGENIYSENLDKLITGGIYFVTISTKGEEKTQRILIDP